MSEDRPLESGSAVPIAGHLKQRSDRDGVGAEPGEQECPLCDLEGGPDRARGDTDPSGRDGGSQNRTGENLALRADE